MRFDRLAILASVATLTTGAQAITLINGSFEAGPAPDFFLTVFAGEDVILGWSVGGSGGSLASVDLIGPTLWEHDAGSRSVDLSGAEAGELSQSLATVAGENYVVRFSLAGNPVLGPVEKTLRVSVDGNDQQTYTFDTSSTSLVNMNWVRREYRFTAQNDSTTLAFTSMTPGAYGPALDNVSVRLAADVPEPAAWAMMLGGFGTMGAAMRRRKRMRATLA